MIEPTTKMARRKILFIVGNELAVLRALRWIFEKDYQVHTFESAVAARKAIRRRRPLLVISDNYMPKVDGLVFLREIRKAFPATRTMLLTGGLIDDRIKYALATREIDAFVQKPWDLNDLLERVHELVQRPASR